MSLLTPSEERTQVAHDRAVRRSFRSPQEIAMRDALEAWCHARWPDGRVVHELVMGRGSVRADVAAITPDHIAAFEIKSDYDDTTRLLHQVGMFRLAVPELWIVTTERHSDDARILRYLMPSVGELRVTGLGYGTANAGTIAVEIVTEAQPFVPLPEALLDILWVKELAAEAERHRVFAVNWSRLPAHKKLADAMLVLGADERLAAVCRQLRVRDAIWRADPPMQEAAE